MSPALIPPEPKSSRFRRWRTVWTVLLLLGAIASGIYWSSRPDMAAMMRRARLASLQGHHERAIDTVEQVLLHEPDNVPALILAGDTAFAMDRFDEALAYYRRVPEGSSEAAIHARLRCGRIEMHHSGNAVAAEADFRAALNHVPEDRNALFQLASLLGIQARRSEAVPFILRLFRLGNFNSDFLALLESDSGALFNVDELQRYQKATPDSPGVLVGQAWHTRNSGQTKETLDLLGRAIQIDPDFAEARIALADFLWDSGRHDTLRLLLAESESKTLDDARVWLVRGQLAEHDGEPDEAARCFWETLLRDPTNRIGTYKLFQYFTSIADDTTAAWLQSRVNQLLELRATSDSVTSKQHTDAASMQLLVEQLDSVGRIWEAWGWCVVARDVDPQAKWAVAGSQSFYIQLQDAPLTRVGRAVDFPFDLSRLPIPNWEQETSGDETLAPLQQSRVTFRDDADSAGLTFQYFNSPSPPEAGQFMYEFNGGGCGVLDYDADGWPDLHFTQGCRFRSRGRQSEHLDRLFRNLGDGHFVDVTNSTGLFEDRFSTGVAVGDFDNDGFADCYVANIGGNRLFRNNGDGTFADVTMRAGVDDERWSTSCVLADLNGDSLPDIYSVNYLEGESVFETICQHDDGRPRMCMPFHFPASQDQLFLNLGDGRFVNATEVSGVQVPNGKGLGVVAADWQGNGRLNLFVANDTVPNSFFVNQGVPQDREPLFEEQAMSAGVALNHAGRAEGCMGIAVGDVDGDGGLDIFVTNFLYESNTLYRAVSGLFFTDMTAESGFAEPSLAMLGFGTQFLDADLNGQLDLIVTNGHIDDYRRYGRPYQMSPQFFYNSGDGRFSMQPGVETGAYFTDTFLGRSLAKWDWNRDGREDAVVSHLDHPAALLTNTTQQHGRSLSLRLRGRQSARDAIGTTVTVHVGDKRIIRQLTAGDGYQASNERLLVFGLSDSADVDRVDVAWPSGQTEAWQNLEADGEYLMIEGVTQAFRLDSVRRPPAEQP